MAVSYKGLVIKFGGDTTGLQDALKSVQKQARNAQSNLRDVNRELKFDPSNADLLALKMNALNKSVEETKKQLDMYKQALQQLESKKQSGAKLTAQEEAQYDSLKLAIVRCERQLDSYGSELADTARQAEGSKTALGKLGQTIEDNADAISNAGSKVSSAGTALSGGIIGAAGALTGLASSQEEAIQRSGVLVNERDLAEGKVPLAENQDDARRRLNGVHRSSVDRQRKRHRRFRGSGAILPEHQQHHASGRLLVNHAADVGGRSLLLDAQPHHVV